MRVIRSANARECTNTGEGDPQKLVSGLFAVNRSLCDQALPCHHGDRRTRWAYLWNLLGLSLRLDLSMSLYPSSVSVLVGYFGERCIDDQFRTEFASGHVESDFRMLYWPRKREFSPPDMSLWQS